ncbi:PQQ-binding-like beta-propeller repeat protein [Conexibacter sp. JD483]|uniref:outer membrane protein assembly factor BamB family protein n=1 Tax=unclassified Conexibacter TaxID=2627773 RepID=UPI00271EC24E|nr:MULTISPECIES: PQQ-binding-like beta-propeller repeat protein [unclassified Conexibacter]MDO8189349.1 PQQ-binding-like beta-propeller repeat protein [Conexibacter sp. CPCC 205706]MDO8200279.1 PQQ-binding-like beta-propeller repeat protein [Conexibacter sp. CPCC 205762]MDR9372760.1 PQQ-binding-like beta-propeller repeat protein [Conexibacter sp. JD483]
MEVEQEPSDRAPRTRARERKSTPIILVVLLLTIAMAALTAYVIADNSDESNKQIASVSNGEVKLTAAEAKGRELFGETCAACHTLRSANASGQIGPNLDQLKPTRELVLSAIEVGRSSARGQMPGGLYSGAEAEDVAAYIVRATNKTIRAAPAFSAAELDEKPTDNWITNGGTLRNDRYSPLTQINDTNVDQLRGVWRTSLGSGTAAKYSQEGQPIVYDGVMYVPTGADDIFALDVETGKTLWRYEARLPAEIATACCGWNNRGVAIGDGKVYVARLDARLVALDMRSGRVLWDTRVGKPEEGRTMTAAPLYYDGKVFTGVAGGEFGVRGHLSAFDARSGRQVWRFYTIPAPGEVGSDTWPDNDSWRYGGAPVWQTPSVDPDLGLIYFSTGNASPDLNGSERPGDNLFAVSIVALNVRDGTYKWHFQQVRHDIWDYDSPSPTVLFDSTVDGRAVKGIAEPGKTGFLYVLDRANGRPIWPIVDRAVPQNRYQATSPTQPYPTLEPFSRGTVTDEDIAKLKEIARSASPDGRTPEIKKGELFTPYDRELVAMAPSAAGGNNWPPSSFNDKTKMIYICSQEGAMALSTFEVGRHVPGQQFIGSTLIPTGFNNTGHVTAYSMETGRIAWRVEFPGESCYSGTVTTAGNLVFVGRNTGQLEAYNATNGRLLWRFQTGAGANSTVTSFQHKGKQYIAFLAGGNALAATPRADYVWLFGLDGTLGEADAAGTGTGITHAGEVGAEEGRGPERETPGNAGAGRTVFADNCSTCHGIDGRGGNGGPDLTAIPAARNLSDVIDQVVNGGGSMPAFGGTLDQRSIADVSAYVVQVVAGGGDGD